MNPPRPNILVIDDERSMREFLAILLEKEGYHVVCAASGEAGLDQLAERPFHIVLSDLKMKGLTGLDVLQRVTELSPGTEVIIMTAHATTETAIAAMKLGAYDYLIKPFKLDEVRVVVTKALEKAMLVRENVALRQQVADKHTFEGMVGRSAAMRRLFDLVDRIADTRATALIHGESGTGKELVAQAIHSRGDGTGPFVPVNCGAIPADLIEAELFGFLKGAFTGASKDKLGLFQAAQGGSLFLDEIGELPMGTQVKLLRVLQEKRVKRVGSVTEEPVDCRIIAATNRDLRQMVQDGEFRQDLYYRLNIIEIEIPPLRDRREDIPLLVEHFVERYSREHGRPRLEVDDSAMATLTAYPFPGNIRELENIVERMVTLSNTSTLGRDLLPVHIMQTESFNRLADDLELADEGIELEAMVERLERNLLRQALERSGGVRKQAARLLGISFRSLRYRLDKYGIDQDDADGAH